MVQIFYSHHLDLPLQTLSIQCWGNNHQNLWSQCWCFLWSLQLSRWWIVKLSSRYHWSLDWSWKNSSLLLLESENIKYHQLSWLISFVAEELIRMKSIFLEGQLSALPLLYKWLLESFSVCLVLKGGWRKWLVFSVCRKIPDHRPWLQKVFLRQKTN